MINKLILFLGVLLFTSNINAGINGFTVHSRANCGNNESISWDLTKAWWLRTFAQHRIFDKEKNEWNIHWVYSSNDYELTRRSAAVHWGEGAIVFWPTPFWLVTGLHLTYEPDKNVYYTNYTITTNCDIYNGWWDNGELNALLEPDY